MAGLLACPVLASFPFRRSGTVDLDQAKTLDMDLQLRGQLPISNHVSHGIPILIQCCCHQHRNQYHRNINQLRFDQLLLSV